MGILRSQHTRSALFTRRGGTLAVIVGLHALVVGALIHAKFEREAEVEAPHLQVIFLAEQNAEQPRVEPPKLEQPPVRVVMPQIDIPVIDMPDSRALTVAHTPAPPSPPPAAPAIDPGIPVAVDSVDFLRRDKPRYPPQAKRARAEGIVYLQVIIDPEGKPREVVVHRSSGFAQLDAAAREAVLGWLFKPYRENGIARSARAIVPVQFGLMASGGMPPRDRHRGEQGERGPGDHVGSGDRGDRGMGDRRDDHDGPAFAGTDGH